MNNNRNKNIKNDRCMIEEKLRWLESDSNKIYHAAI